MDLSNTQVLVLLKLRNISIAWALRVSTASFLNWTACTQLTTAQPYRQACFISIANFVSTTSFKSRCVWTKLPGLFRQRLLSQGERNSRILLNPTSILIVCSGPFCPKRRFRIPIGQKTRSVPVNGVRHSRLSFGQKNDMVRICLELFLVSSRDGTLYARNYWPQASTTICRHGNCAHHNSNPPWVSAHWDSLS